MYRAKERELEIIMRKAQDMLVVATSEAPITKQEREKVVEEAKASVKTMRTETEKAQVEVSAEDLATPLVPGEPVEEGITLVVLEKGNLFGSRGIVTQRNKGRGRVLLRVAGVEVKMERHLLGIPHRSGLMGFSNMATGGGKDGSGEEVMSSKEKRMLKMLQEELVDPWAPSMKKNRKIGSLVRTISNTLDVRGHGFDRMQTMSASFLERAVNNAEEYIYIHHGASKDVDEARTKLRTWLKKSPLVRKCGPAALSEGGDAFTIIEFENDA